MKRSLVLALLATSAWAEGTPRIEFDRTVYDFGTTSMVESVTGTFTFTNTGDGPLKLEKPRPSCACTAALLSRDELKPGELGQLVFTIALDSRPEELAKVIFLSSNDPLHPVVELGVAVTVIQAFEASPADVSFGSIRLGATSNLTVTVRRLDRQKFTVTKVDSTRDLISGKAEPLEDGKAARITISIKADGLPGLLSEQARIYTVDSKGPAFGVPVKAELVGDIEIDPPELVWGMPDPSHPTDDDSGVLLTRSISITSTQKERSLRLRNISCSLKEIKVKLVTVERGHQYDIELTLPKRLTEPRTGTITFETNLPSLPKVEVPLTVNIWTR